MGALTRGQWMEDFLCGVSAPWQEIEIEGGFPRPKKSICLSCTTFRYWGAGSRSDAQRRRAVFSTKH